MPQVCSVCKSPDKLAVEDAILRRVPLSRIAAQTKLSVFAMQRHKAHITAGEEHEYRRRSHLIEWHGWHAFRRGLASNLNDLGVPDLTIQRILRHANVATTRKAYIKVREPHVVAGMAQLEAEIRRAETIQ